MNSCRSGPGSRGTWKAMPSAARPPSGAACASPCCGVQAFPPGSVGNDPVEDLPPVRRWPPGGFPRPELFQDRFDSLPQAIRDFPNHPQRLSLTSLPSSSLRHPRVSFPERTTTPEMAYTPSPVLTKRRFSDSYLGLGV